MQGKSKAEMKFYCGIIPLIVPATTTDNQLFPQLKQSMYMYINNNVAVHSAESTLSLCIHALYLASRKDCFLFRL